MSANRAAKLLSQSNQGKNCKVDRQKYYGGNGSLTVETVIWEGARIFWKSIHGITRVPAELVTPITPNSGSKINLLKQLLEAGVGTDRIEPRIYSEVNKILVAFLECLPQTLKRRILFVQRYIY